MNYESIINSVLSHVDTWITVIYGWPALVTVAHDAFVGASITVTMIAGMVFIARIAPK